jgi:hypothetical protein
MQLSELGTEVEDLLLDLPSGTTTRTTTWINKAIRDACTRHNFKFMEAESSFTTVENTRQLGSKDALWKEHRALPYLVNQDGSTDEFNWTGSESDMVRTYGAAAPAESNPAPIDAGDPHYLLERPTAIDVYPFPDELSDWDDGNYRVRVPYWAYPAVLVQETDTHWLTENAPWYVIFGATSEGYARNQNDEKAAMYAGRAEGEYRRIVRLDKMSRLPDRMNLAVRSDVYAGKSRTLRG